VFEPTIRVWRSGTTRKQPANLGFEAAEESLSILPDYKPTVRPRPSAVDHLDRTLHCRAHGGGRRCQHEGCPKAAESGGTPNCAGAGAASTTAA
jgi:hypothetical protein